MSPDGGLVAVGTDKEVLVYHIDDFINNAELSPKILKLSGIFSGMDVFSQCMYLSLFFDFRSLLAHILCVESPYIP